MTMFEALPDDVRKELEAEYTRRSVTPVPGPSGHRMATLLPERKPVKITVKSTNVKRITQQLPLCNGSNISPTKSKLFAKQSNLSMFNVSGRELRKLDIDPESGCTCQEETWWLSVIESNHHDAQVHNLRSENCRLGPCGASALCGTSCAVELPCWPRIWAMAEILGGQYGHERISTSLEVE